MYKIGEEEMVICPFNRYHIVSKLRIQKHIFKCRKNNIDTKLATCFYNYSHKVKPENILAHYEICSYKNRLESSRYYELPSNSAATVSVKNDSQKNFPNINVRSLLFSDWSNLRTSCEDIPKFSLSSDFEESESRNSDTPDENDSSESESNLEPLPLPKTISKAFVCDKQQPNDIGSSKTSQQKELGRGKYFLTSKLKSFSTTNHTASGVNTTQTDMSKKKSSKIFPGTSHYSESVISSMFDDATTLKSEDIVFDDDDYDDDDVDDDYDDDDDDDDDNDGGGGGGSGDGDNYGDKF